MKSIKRFTAVLLACLLIFSSMSVMAFADDGGNFSITTKIYRNNGTAWVETDKVISGENVKARVFLGTDWYTTGGTLLFFYDNSFFSDSYTLGSDVTVSQTYSGSPYVFTAVAYPESDDYKAFDNIAYNGTGLTQEQKDNYNFIYTQILSNGVASKLDSSKWCLEYDLTVTATSGKGDFIVIPETIASTTNQDGQISFNKGADGARSKDCKDNMWNFDAALALDNADSEVEIVNPVTLTFDAGDGSFGSASTADVEGMPGEKVTKPVPTRDGYKLLGWTSVAGGTSVETVDIFPDASATYYAVWEESSSDNLAINTRFFRKDSDGAWVETETVKRGEQVKARVYVATDYLAGQSEYIFFYDNTFFTPAMPEEGDIKDIANTQGFAADKEIEGKFYTGSYSKGAVNSLIDAGIIDEDFAAKNGAVLFNIDFATTNSTVAKYYDDEEYTVDAEVDNDLWIAEFDFTVADTASGEANLFVVDDSVVRPVEPNYDGIINVPRAHEGTSCWTAEGMWMWDVAYNTDADAVYFKPVSLDGTATFEAYEGDTAAAEYGYFTKDGAMLDGEDAFTYTVNGEVGTYFSTSDIPVPERTGYTFIGWYDASIEEPTADDVLAEVPNTIGYENEVYKAFWQKNATISFETFGAQDIADIENVKPGEAFAPVLYTTDGKKILEPSKEGYNFLGWSTVSDETTGALDGLLPDLPATYPAEDTTYYAVWDRAIYSISYYVIDASKENVVKRVATQSYDFGTEFAQDIAAYKTPAGYVFDGWYYDATLSNKVPEGATVPARNMDLYAKVSYDIIPSDFVTNGGEFSDGTTSTTVFTLLNDYIKAPEDPTREGYTFKGWYPTVGAQITADRVTYTATWEKAKADVTFYSEEADEDGNYTTIVYQPYKDVEYGSDLYAPADPYLEGREFLGWSTVEGDKTAIVDLPEVFESEEDVAYYAIFDDIEYTVTYYVDGSVNGDVETYTYLDALTERAVPDKEGYETIGWAWSQYDDANEEWVEISAIPEKMPAADLKAEAVYEINAYTLTFDAGDGYFDKDPDKHVSESEIDYGANIMAPADDPELTGYEFGGWAKPDAPETAINDFGKMPEGGAEYVAIWTPKTYTIKWYPGSEAAAFADGSEYKTTTCDFGADITEVTDKPEREGYQLIGWSETEGATQPDELGKLDTEGKTLYAVWAPDTGVGYWLYIYEMDTAGEYAAEPTHKIQHSDGIVDETRTLTYTAPEGFTLDTSSTDGTEEKSVLTGTIPATGALVLKAYLAREAYDFTAYAEDEDGEDAVFAGPTAYLYGAKIADPGTPVKSGYRFLGWSTVKGDESAIITLDTMPAEAVTVYAVFTEDNFTATFDAGEGCFDNDPTKTTVETPVTYGDDIDKPADPTREGYTFDGWTTPDAPDTVIEDWPQIMGDEAVEYIAKWSKNDYTVTYYVPAREADTASANYGKLTADKADYTVYAGPFTVEFEAELDTAKVENGPEIVYYKFIGWTDENGDTVTVPDTMPAKDLKFYAKYEREAVYLIKESEDATTVIDRGLGYYGDRDSYTVDDGAVARNTTQEYFEYDPTTSVWYVYGIALRCTDEKLDAEYVDVAGDGYYVLTPSYTSEAGVNYAGTGARIDVYDRVTGELVETFYIVVFGDVNGDGYYVTTDVSAIKQDVSHDNRYSNNLSVDAAQRTAMVMASDLERNTRLTTGDATSLQNVVAHLAKIDQVTGLYTYTK